MFIYKSLLCGKIPPKKKKRKTPTPNHHHIFCLAHPLEAGHKTPGVHVPHFWNP